MRRLATILRDKMRMMREDATAVARVVEQAFAGHDEVEDDNLDPQLRQLFYDLQDAEVLAIKRHEYTQEGQLLRGYRWHVIDEPVAPETPRQRPAVDPLEDLYGGLQEDAWARRVPN